MLSQIEREQANPTLAVTLRIAQAFGMSLGELVEIPGASSSVSVIRSADRAYHYHSDDFCHIRTLSPLNLEKDVEFYEIRLKKAEPSAAPRTSRARGSFSPWPRARWWWKAPATGRCWLRGIPRAIARMWPMPSLTPAMGRPCCSSWIFTVRTGPPGSPPEKPPSSRQLAFHKGRGTGCALNMESQPQTAPTPESESALLAIRREKLAKLKDAGVNAYGGRFDTTHTLPALREAFSEGLAVRAAGRISARRDMGKTQFFDISDLEGRFPVLPEREERARGNLRSLQGPPGHR